jgi:hypothetical protein
VSPLIMYWPSSLPYLVVLQSISEVHVVATPTRLIQSQEPKSMVSTSHGYPSLGKGDGIQGHDSAILQGIVEERPGDEGEGFGEAREVEGFLGI